jgi:transcriptional regulator with XRE-family HTH domain
VKVGGIVIDLNYLKQQRLSKGITLQQIAACLGYSTPNGFWKVEKGLTRLRADQIMKLKTALQIDLNYLIKED